MAVREELLLDLSQALDQIRDLEVELDSLLQPIEIPVEIESTQALRQLQSEIQAADADEIDIDVNTGDLDGAERSLRQMGDEIEDADEDARRFERTLDNVGDEAEDVGRKGRQSFGSLRSSIGGLLAVTAGFVGLREVTQFFGESIEAASDLEESTSKAQVVFGSFFDDIQDFANTAPQALGLANSAALEFTGTFGNLFTALGLSQEAAADLAPDIVQLGADLASFNNIEVTDALEKLRAGLVGEAEPLRALGVNLNAATVEAKALELGLQDSTGAIDDAAKVQARYALILEQTTTAQGDFARTADGLANQQRTLTAEFEEFRAEVGEALIPLFQELLDIAPDVLVALEEFIPVLGEIATEFATAVSGGVEFLDFLGLIPTSASEGADELERAADEGIVLAGVLDSIGATPISGIEALVLDSIGLTDALRNLREAAEDDIPNPVANVIEELRDLDGLVAGEALTDFLRDVREAAELSGDEYERFLRLLLGDQAGIELSADQLALIASEIERIGDADFIPPPLDELADGASRAAAELPAATIALTDFGDSLSTLVEQDFGFDAIADQIRDGFAQLPDQLDAAGAALRDEENEIITDFTDFLDQLDDEIAAREQFNRNIALLEAFGLDQLAEVFRDAGLDAAQALADAVSNPDEAARAEQLLDEAAARQANNYVTAFGVTVGERLAELSPPEFEVIPVLGPLDTSSLDSSFLSINVGAGSPGAGAGGSPVIINNTYNTTPAPTTETTRATQETASIIRNISNIQ